MKIKLILIAVAISLSFLILSSARAQSYREAAPISSVYIYQQMLSYAQTQENDKIIKLLGNIEEILNAINNNFGKNLKADIANAINKGSNEEISASIYTLILYDIKDVFRSVEEGLNVERLSLSRLEERLKLAYLDYLAVSPEARKRDFNLDRDIRKIFTELLTADLARAVSLGGGSRSILQNRLVSIEDSYRKIFGL